LTKKIELRNEQEILCKIIEETLKGLAIPSKKSDLTMLQIRRLCADHNDFFSAAGARDALEGIRDNHVGDGVIALHESALKDRATRWIRVWFSQKRYAKWKRDFLPPPGGGPRPPLGQRLHYIKDMINNERDARDMLYFTFTKFERQLKPMGDDQGLMSQSEWSKAFAYSANFRNTYSRILKQLERAYENDWPNLWWGDITRFIVAEIESISVKIFAVSLKYYEILAVIENLVARQGFQALIPTLMNDPKTQASKYMKGKHFGLENLLLAPLNRVDYYKGVLEKIQSLTPKDRPERFDIDEGHHRLTKMLKQMEDNKIVSKDNVRASEVNGRFSKITGFDQSSFSFLPPDERSFVMEMDLQLLKSTMEKDKEKWKGHDVSLMVFTDLIVISSKVDKGPKPLAIEENGIILMCQAIVHEHCDIGDPKFPSDTLIKLVSETGKDTRHDFKLAFKTKSDKALCVSKLLTLVMNNRLCFGRPLSKVSEENGDNIPNIIPTVLSALRKKEAQKLEGIFRIAGEAKYLMRMKAIFDRWKPDQPDVDLSSYDSFDIASLLKQWFRELPVPVLTYKVYDKYVSVDDPVNYEEFLADLPELNRKSILAVMSFNVELTKHSETNMMTPANIAICWGPTILRPLKDDMVTSMRIPRVNQIVEGLVKWLAEHPEHLPAPEKKKKKERERKEKREKRPKSPRPGKSPKRERKKPTTDLSASAATPAPTPAALPPPTSKSYIGPRAQQPAYLGGLEAALLNRNRAETEKEQESKEEGGEGNPLPKPLFPQQSFAGSTANSPAGAGGGVGGGSSGSMLRIGGRQSSHRSLGQDGPASPKGGFRVTPKPNLPAPVASPTQPQPPPPAALPPPPE